MDIFNALTGFFDFPAIVLAGMLAAAWYFIRTAQQRDDFDFGNALKDENGKESAVRIGVIVALCFSAWGFMYDTVHNHQVNPQIFLIYLIVWSGTKIAEKLVDALVAKWSK